MPDDDKTQRLTVGEIQSADRELDALAPTFPVLKPECRSGNGVAVAGRDGFYFIADGANRWEQQYLGTFDPGEDVLQHWVEVILGRARAVAARGVALCNLIVPEKQVIYPELRWPAGGVSGDRRPVRRLQAAVPADSLYYPEAELRAARDAGPVYFRRNSHWNAAGCAIVAHGVLARLGVAVDPSALRFSYRRDWMQHDLQVHFFENGPLEYSALIQSPVEPAQADMAERIPGRNTGMSYEIHNSAAIDPRRAIIFGDSYAGFAGLSYALAEVFAEVEFVWLKAIDWGRVDRTGAQVVIWEGAERFMLTHPRW